MSNLLTREEKNKVELDKTRELWLRASDLKSSASSKAALHAIPDKVAFVKSLRADLAAISADAQTQRDQITAENESASDESATKPWCDQLVKDIEELEDAIGDTAEKIDECATTVAKLRASHAGSGNSGSASESSVSPAVGGDIIGSSSKSVPKPKSTKMKICQFCLCRESNPEKALAHLLRHLTEMPTNVTKVTESIAERQLWEEFLNDAEYDKFTTVLNSANSMMAQQAKQTMIAAGAGRKRKFGEISEDGLSWCDDGAGGIKIAVSKQAAKQMIPDSQITPEIMRQTRRMIYENNLFTDDEFLREVTRIPSSLAVTESSLKQLSEVTYLYGKHGARTDNPNQRVDVALVAIRIATAAISGATAVALNWHKHCLYQESKSAMASSSSSDSASVLNEPTVLLDSPEVGLAHARYQLSQFQRANEALGLIHTTVAGDIDSRWGDVSRILKQNTAVARSLCPWPHYHSDLDSNARKMGDTKLFKKWESLPATVRANREWNDYSRGADRSSRGRGGGGGYRGGGGRGGGSLSQLRKQVNRLQRDLASAQSGKKHTKPSEQ